MLMLKRVVKRLKHVKSVNSDQTPQAKNYGSQMRKQHVDTIQAAEQAWYTYARQKCCRKLPSKNEIRYP